MTIGSGPHKESDRNGNLPNNSRADPLGQHFEAVEMLVDTGATFTKAPRDLLEQLGVPVERFYTAELADGSRVERTRGRTVIRLEGTGVPHTSDLRRGRESRTCSVPWPWRTPCWRWTRTRGGWYPSTHLEMTTEAE